MMLPCSRGFQLCAGGPGEEARRFDINGAKQAAEVAERQRIDPDAVRTWCEREHPEKGPRMFRLFESYLSGA